MTLSQPESSSPGEIEVLFGSEVTTMSEHAWAPFDDRIISFLVDLSRLVMADPRARPLPDVISLGYWCRKSSLDSMKASHPSDQVMRGRGLAFHVPPANVPLNFAYSLICGLLAGNSNIVRLSTNESIEVETFIELMTETLGIPSHEEVARRICLVRYGHDDSVTRHYSLRADARIIWGGDSTVTHIRSIPSKPRSVDVSFADRVSLALVNARRVGELTDSELSACAASFVSDSYTFDQNACSSPKMVVWHGADSVIDEARSRFWPAVERLAKEKDSTAPVNYVNRFVELCEKIAQTDTIASVDGLGSPAARITLRKTEHWEIAASLRFGTFSEARISDMLNLEVLIDERVQTVCYFGYEPSELRSVLSAASWAGVDRVVPFGQALAFDLIWDGYDLVRFLTRQVVVR